MTGEDTSTRGSATAATIGAALMIAAQVGSKATRDALFLDVFDASELPKAMLASALLAPLAVVLMMIGMAKVGPARLVPILYLLNAAAFGAAYALAPSMPRFTAAGLYLHVAVLGAILVSGFWSVVSERFDPHTAKRVIGRITAGAASGGLIGGLTAERVAAWLDARAMLLVLAGLSVGCAVAIGRTGKGSGRTEASEGGVLSGLRYLSEAPYLKLLAVLAVLTAVMSGVLDYAFKAEADAAFTEREDLMTLFAIFYTATSIVTFVAQTALSRRALERLGIGGTIALLPAAVVLGATLGAAVTRLWSVIAVRAAEEVLSNSLFRSGYELLFTPLSPERKRPTKTLIDVGFKRMGDALGSGVVMVVVIVAPGLTTTTAIIAAAVAGVASLWVALQLHRGYVAELAASLKSGRVALDDADILDATTRRTLADTTMAINREQLLEQIEELRRAQSADPSSGEIAPAAEPEPELPPMSRGPSVLDALADLRSGDNKRVRRALRGEIDPRAVAFAIPLLGGDTYARVARRALKRTAPRVVGQLIDALLDDTHPERVRRRLPEIIGAVGSRRAALGLFEGLGVPAQAVQDRCVSALRELVAKEPSLAPARADVFAAAQRALGGEDVSVPRVFAILGLALDPEPLRLALGALRGSDVNLRGTSFEYLENVLPEALRAALWPHLVAFARNPARRDAPPAVSDPPPDTRPDVTDLEP